MCVLYVPANMTKYYQALDLTVNGYAKRYFKNSIVLLFSTGSVFYNDMTEVTIGCTALYLLGQYINITSGR